MQDAKLTGGSVIAGLDIIMYTPNIEYVSEGYPCTGLEFSLSRCNGTGSSGCGVGSNIDEELLVGVTCGPTVSG